MKKLVKNLQNEYETDSLWYRRLPGISHWYFGKVKKTLCAWMKEGNAVLDFGCGEQRLKPFLPSQIEYVGYDTIPGYSDIDSYKRMRPDIVFAISVLEHLSYKELDELLKWFSFIKVKQLLVSIPIKNRPIVWTILGFKRRIIREHHLETYKYDMELIHKKISIYFVKEKMQKYHNQMMSSWSLRSEVNGKERQGD